MLKKMESEDMCLINYLLHNTPVLFAFLYFFMGKIKNNCSFELKISIDYTNIIYSKIKYNLDDWWLSL